MRLPVGAVLLATTLAGVSAILQLSMPVYSLLLFDHVISTGKVATLVSLTIMMLLVQGSAYIIDVCRSEILIRTAASWSATNRDHQWTPRTGGQSEVEIVANFLTSRLALTVTEAPFTVLFASGLFLISYWLCVLFFFSSLLMIVINVTSYWLTEPTLRLADATSEAAHSGMGRFDDHDFPRTWRWRFITSRQGRHLSLEAQYLRFTALRRRAWLDALRSTARVLIQIAGLAMAAVLITSGKISPASLIAITILLNRGLSPIDQISSSYASIWKVLQCVKRTIVLSPVPTGAASGVISIQSIIIVENLGYSRINEKVMILNAINLRFFKGELVLLVGPSGSGKSVLASLLSGCIQPTLGRVMLDHVVMSSLPGSTLGKSIAYMPQHCRLPSGTIECVISGGELGKSDLVVLAAKTASAHEQIITLPDGYSTIVGPDRAPLPFTLVRKLALAHVLFGEHTVVVLDSPTMGFGIDDSRSLAHSLLTLKARGRIIIIATQDGELFPVADRIVIMSNGQVESIRQGGATLTSNEP